MISKGEFLSAGPPQRPTPYSALGMYFFRRTLVRFSTAFRPLSFLCRSYVCSMPSSAYTPRMHVCVYEYAYQFVSHAKYSISIANHLCTCVLCVAHLLPSAIYRSVYSALHKGLRCVSACATHTTYSHTQYTISHAPSVCVAHLLPSCVCCPPIANPLCRPLYCLYHPLYCRAVCLSRALSCAL